MILGRSGASANCVRQRRIDGHQSAGRSVRGLSVHELKKNEKNVLAVPSTYCSMKAIAP